VHMSHMVDFGSGAGSERACATLTAVVVKNHVCASPI
jgi:hypothetical protein